MSVCAWAVASRPSLRRVFCALGRLAALRSHNGSSLIGRNDEREARTKPLGTPHPTPHVQPPAAILPAVASSHGCPE